MVNIIKLTNSESENTMCIDNQLSCVHACICVMIITIVWITISHVYVHCTCMDKNI